MTRQNPVIFESTDIEAWKEIWLNYSVVARDRGMTASISIDDDLPRLVVDKPPQYLIPQ